MVIGIDASRANSAERTGTEWYAFHVIQEFKNIIPDGTQVRLYTQEPLKEDMLPLPENWSAAVLRWPPKILWTQLRLSIELLFHKVDALYVPAHTIPLIHPKKTVTVIHDVGFLHEQSLYNTTATPTKNRLIRFLVNGIIRVVTLGRYSASENDYHRFSLHRALSGASDIITISDFSKHEILQYSPLSGPILTRIYNGFHAIDFPTSQNSHDVILQKYNVKSGEFLTTLGRVEEKKNSLFLVQMFSEYVQSGYTGKLIFIGKPGFGFDRIQKEVERLKLSDRVHFTGYVPDDEVAILLKHSEFFVFPTLYEGFGMPILEAMNAGVPVICSDIPVMHEVGGNAALYASPRDTREWVQKLQKLQSDAMQKQQLKEAGKKRVELFSWKKTALETWRILQNT